jgi:rhodanese-related sulfurtransferase
MNALTAQGGQIDAVERQGMLAEANTAVSWLAPGEVRDMIGKGNVLIVDVRDAPELAAGGKLDSAVNASRGTLEFRADPESPSHDPAFQKDKKVLVDCASGGRAALSGKILKVTSASSRSTMPAASRNWRTPVSKPGRLAGAVTGRRQRSLRSRPSRRGRQAG